MNAASKFGPVAEQEFENAADHEKPRLESWLETLPGLSDEHFFDVAKAAIFQSAVVASWSGNWNADHCRATAVYADAKRRHREAGHVDDCQGQTLYGRAHSMVMREQGYAPMPSGKCRCDLSGTAQVIR
ncbi:hypothetical protein [Amycolatopsis japonica]